MVFPDGTTGRGDSAVWIEGAWFPDLDDAATKGCLLSLVRELYATLQSTEYVGDGDPVNLWRWGAFRGPSEEAALIAALEGAPCP
jgi:hypothetical protein